MCSAITTASMTALFAACALAAPAFAQQPFFEGKQINLIVGTEAGGGYDIYGRAVARHIGRHIPGRPTIVPQNMPGAGSAKAAEFIYTLAPKDGTTFGIIFPGIVMEPLIDDKKKFRFEATKFEYLGSADSGTRLCVTHAGSKIKTFDDALKLPSNFGGSAAGSSTTDYAQLLVNLAGAKMKIINGYRSSIDTILAAERGEVDGLCGYDSSSFRAQKPDWFNTPKSHMILQTALETNQELMKIGVPPLWNYISGENRRIAELVFAQQEFHRPFVLPPGTPADRVAILRTAFMATMKDAEFLADAGKMKLSIGPKDGPTVARLVQNLYASPPELVEKMRKALKP